MLNMFINGGEVMRIWLVFLFLVCVLLGVAGIDFGGSVMVGWDAPEDAGDCEPGSLEYEVWVRPYPFDPPPAAVLVLTTAETVAWVPLEEGMWSIGVRSKCEIDGEVVYSEGACWSNLPEGNERVWVVEVLSGETEVPGRYYATVKVYWEEVVE